LYCVYSEDHCVDTFVSADKAELCSACHYKGSIEPVNAIKTTTKGGRKFYQVLTPIEVHRH